MVKQSVLVVERHPHGQGLFSGLDAFGFKVLEVDDAMPFLSSSFLYQLLFLPVALCNLTLSAFLCAPPVPSC